MDYSKREVIKNIFEQMIYANFTEEERKSINVEEYTDGLVADIEDWLNIVKDNIRWELSLHKDTIEQRETDIWHFEK